MDINIVEKKKDMIEIEFFEKEVAISLVGELLSAGIDAYWYEPHPLIPGFRVHLDSNKPAADLKNAVASLKKDWADMSTQVIGKL